jgi:hypothetical protein
LVVVSAIITAYLWHELRSEREVTAGLRTVLSESLARAPVAQGAASGIDTVAPVPLPAPETTRDVPYVAATRGSGVVFIPPNGSISQQHQLNDPEYIRARFTTLRSRIVQAHPGLAEEIGINTGEADRLFDLLTETQMAMTAQHAIAATGDEQADRTSMAEITRMHQDLQRQQADSIRELLGDARFAQWQAYQPTRPTRLKANVHADALARAGSPLDSVQLNILVAALLDEQRSLQRDTVALGRTVDPSNPQSRIQAQEALRNRQAQVNQRILDTATTYLSPQQLALLRAQFEQQDAINVAIQLPR